MKKHGLSKTRIYKRWEGIIQRCNNSKSPLYRFYGAKGIKVCEQWKNPVNFYQWAKDSGFESHLEIDRIDSKGDYCPENCRWVTSIENKRNVAKRKSTNGSNFGITQTKNGKYQVQIQNNGKLARLGTFINIEAAKNIRDRFLNGETLEFKRRIDVGIYKTKSGKFLARVVNKGVIYKVGLYTSREVAIKERQKALEERTFF